MWGLKCARKEDNRLVTIHLVGSNLIHITEQAKLYTTERKTSQHKPVLVTLQASSQTQLPTLVVGEIGHF